MYNAVVECKVITRTLPKCDDSRFVTGKLKLNALIYLSISFTAFNNVHFSHLHILHIDILTLLYIHKN